MFEINRLKLKGQLWLLITITLFIIILIQVIYYLQVKDSIEARTKQYEENIINRIVYEITGIAEDMVRGANTLAYNRHVQKFLISEDPEERAIDLYPFIYDVLKYVKSSNENIVDIMISDKSGHIMTIDYKYRYSIFSDLGEQYKFKEKDFTRPTFTTVNYNKQEIMRYYAYILPIMSNRITEDLFNKVGNCIIISDNKFIENRINDINITSNSYFFILDDENNLVAGNTNVNTNIYNNYLNTTINKERTRTKFMNQDSFIYTKKISAIGWKVISIVPVNELAGEIGIVKNYVLLIGIVMTLLLFLIDMIISFNIIKPITRISSFMTGIDQINYYERINISGPPDMKVLADNINNLLDRFQNMTKVLLLAQRKLYQEKLIRKETELSSLQNQINPHFLYNTLNCISSIGLANGIQDIAKITSSMSKIFRYSIKDEGVVKIADEIECVKSYFEIINIRYQNKINTHINIPPGIVEKKVLKMILQPIVENAVYHGLEAKKGNGEINLTIYKQKPYIIFKITDNGIGIEEEKLDELIKVMDTGNQDNNKKSWEPGIGLVNINARIKLKYGPSYGLSIDSKVNSGTTVTVKIPIV